MVSSKHLFSDRNHRKIKIKRRLMVIIPSDGTALGETVKFDIVARSLCTEYVVPVWVMPGRMCRAGLSSGRGPGAVAGGSP